VPAASSTECLSLARTDSLSLLPLSAGTHSCMSNAIISGISTARASDAPTRDGKVSPCAFEGQRQHRAHTLQHPCFSHTLSLARSLSSHTTSRARSCFSHTLSRARALSLALLLVDDARASLEPVNETGAAALSACQLPLLSEHGTHAPITSGFLTWPRHCSDASH